MVKITAKRQTNNLLQIREWLWDHIEVKEGETVVIQDDESPKGKFISFWKQNGE